MDREGAAPGGSRQCWTWQHQVAHLAEAPCRRCGSSDLDAPLQSADECKVAPLSFTGLAEPPPSTRVAIECIDTIPTEALSSRTTRGEVIIDLEIAQWLERAFCSDSLDHMASHTSSPLGLVRAANGEKLESTVGCILSSDSRRQNYCTYFV